ncbi:hypothetical protein BKA67DRAFT_154238 [Truncatella angustata]|uniref:Uncharacterized protein n=1 Tax=Truncatella angustata TaxID=152316 RepID=A0A9P8UQ96_9PEZI|nr:uncharacterized protein BKA67DRAFT_154238 [Truncatella angustata]KAH6656384.1 hypothetical protein BKA67DRAFT_154238 [Truncatella angustata]KAH8196632.1 hypothetical protein TruAng_009191 [Truncatella angustata]
MVSTAFLGAFLLVASASSVFATPVIPGYSEHVEILAMRASSTVDPNAVTGVDCTNPSVDIVFHDQNVAELGICGGIAGAITKCGGAPQSTTGESGTALFTLKAATSGATINISKGRWEGCIRAARAVCPTGSISGTCVGGASTGNVDFTLDNP